MAATPELELRDAPSDGISAVKFSPLHTNLLLASAWDATLRLYDVGQNVLRASVPYKSPLLDCCFSNTTSAFAGAVDGALIMLDLDSKSEKVLGVHEKAIRCVEYSTEEGIIITGSWDTNVKLWDPRSPQPLLGTYAQPNKVFALALAGERLVVGTAGRYVNVYDLRKMAEPMQRRESSLKHQTRCIRSFPDHSGYALSSVEGRVAIEYFDPAEEVQKQKYVFKCHRALQNGIDTVYPVNTIAFHPVYGTFATGGCDSIVNFWDGANRKRICQLPKYPTSIASLAFNENGTLLAIASSYTFEEGEKDHPPDAIFIHKVLDSDVKPKPRTR